MSSRKPSTSSGKRDPTLAEKSPFYISAHPNAGLPNELGEYDETPEEMANQLKDYVDNGPTEDELKRSIQNITGGFALRVDSNKKIIGYIAMIGFYGLPLNYLDTFNAKVEAVTVAKIKEAFNKY